MFESWQAPPIPTDAAIEPRPVPDPGEPPPLSLVPATLSLVRRQAELILERARAEPRKIREQAREEDLREAQAQLSQELAAQRASWAARLAGAVEGLQGQFEERWAQHRAAVEEKALQVALVQRLLHPQLRCFESRTCFHSLIIGAQNRGGASASATQRVLLPRHDAVGP